MIGTEGEGEHAAGRSRAVRAPWKSGDANLWEEDASLMATSAIGTCSRAPAGLCVVAQGAVPRGCMEQERVGVHCDRTLRYAREIQTRKTMERTEPSWGEENESARMQQRKLRVQAQATEHDQRVLCHRIGHATPVEARVENVTGVKRRDANEGRASFHTGRGA